MTDDQIIEEYESNYFPCAWCGKIVYRSKFCSPECEAEYEKPIKQIAVKLHLILKFHGFRYICTYCRHESDVDIDSRELKKRFKAYVCPKCRHTVHVLIE